MALPQIQHPVYEVYLKSLDRKVKFRPFLVKEEKLLLMAKESDDILEIHQAIRQIIQNCLMEDIVIEDLPMFDIEMIFLNLRAKSIGEKVRLVFNCQNIVEGEPCNTDTDYTLDLTKVKYEADENHTNTIMLGNSVGIKLKYPKLNTTVSIEEDEYQTALKIIAQNIDCIFDADQVYYNKDLSDTEVLEFLDKLTLEQIDNIRNFYNTAPKVVLEDTVTCKKCGYVHTMHTENLLSFFI